jgi:hypothetical protein
VFINKQQFQKSVSLKAVAGYRTNNHKPKARTESYRYEYSNIKLLKEMATAVGKNA